MNNNAISNFEIDGNTIVRPAIMRFGRILTETKPIGDLQTARTSAIRIFDNFGEKNLVIMTTDELRKTIDSNDYLLYQFQPLENDEILVTFNFLKSSATDAMKASATKIHEICISELANHLA